MTTALAFLLLIGPFFAVLCAWVYVMWPEENPFPDERWLGEDRRHG